MPSFNLENKITWMELAPSLQELFKNLQSQIITERDRAIQREKELDKKIDDETNRAKAAEKTLQDNIDKEAQARKDADDGLQDEIDDIKGDMSDVKKNVEDLVEDKKKWDSATGGVNKDLGIGVFNIGDYIVQFGVSMANNKIDVPQYNDPVLNNNPDGSKIMKLWEQTFAKPFPSKCIRVFWYTNSGDYNDDDSDTVHFVDNHMGAMTNEHFYTEHKYVKYIAIGI